MRVSDDDTADLSNVGRVCEACVLQVSGRSGLPIDPGTCLGREELPPLIVLVMQVRSLEAVPDLLQSARDTIKYALNVSKCPELASAVRAGPVEQGADLGRIDRREEERLAEVRRFPVEVPRLDAGKVATMVLLGHLVQEIHDELHDEPESAGTARRPAFRGWDGPEYAPSSAST